MTPDLRSRFEAALDEGRRLMIAHGVDPSIATAWEARAMNEALSARQGAEPDDDRWIDAMYAFDAAVPSHQRGHAEWRARMEAAMRVLYPASPRDGWREEVGRVVEEMRQSGTIPRAALVGALGPTKPDWWSLDEIVAALKACGVFVE